MARIGNGKADRPTNLIRDIDNYNAVGIQDPKGPPGSTADHHQRPQTNIATNFARVA